MISSDMKSGPYISEAEARRFVKTTYGQYRAGTIPEEYMNEPIKRSVIQFGGKREEKKGTKSEETGEK